MTNTQLIRAWKDEEFRSTLSDGQLAEIPHNPAGLVELSDEQLTGAGGATSLACSVIVATFALSCFQSCDCGCGGS